MNHTQPSGAESFGSASSVRGAQLRTIRILLVLAALSLLLLCAGCIGGALANAPAASIPPLPASSPVGESAPLVSLGLDAESGIHPGKRVEIWLDAEGTQPIDVYRLSIDGAATGWTKREALKDQQFVYEWTAGEPGVYEIVGEARDLHGIVGESRLELTVHAHEESTGEVAPSNTPNSATDQGEVPAHSQAQTDEEDLPPVTISMGTVTLPSYPLDEYRIPQIDTTYNWPYYRFDRERFLEDAPLPSDQTYRLIELENEFLRIVLLPELGGRVWQAIHKPTGKTMFYQNQVVKPSPWGPANQLGWLGLGGLEWDLPVNEHGYDWGTPWDVHTFVAEDGAAVVRISTPDDGRFLSAAIDVRLPPQAAYFEIEPRIQNTGDTALQFDYWHTAMLAPGLNNQLGPELRFIIPGDAVRIHSTGDERLPGPDRVIAWPDFGERDLSRLGDWDQYSGFFEYPSAQGPFAGVYDPVTDTGAVRVYPPEIARGSKMFGLGWDDALTSEYYTDDGSAYVELHGGLAPSFSQRAHLDAGESVQWTERWYPVSGIGEFAVAGDAGALSANVINDRLVVGLYPSTTFSGQIVVESPRGKETAHRPLTVEAGSPVMQTFGQSAFEPDDVTIRIEDDQGAVLLSHALEPK